MTAEAARLLARAYAQAARAHAGQRRRGRGDTPGVNHACEVAALVAEAGAEAETVAAAVLHDVVEDSPATLQEIADTYGERVAALVAAVTDPPERAALPRAARKRAQAAHMAQAPCEARRIKIADQTANLRDMARDPSAWRPADAAEYIAGAGEVVDACRGADAALEAAFDAAVLAARTATAPERSAR
jgi:guanosine-3',5'-bis(diphosphate) 3'-pyrophosphohydrolase